jgi:hypothetical protein
MTRVGPCQTLRKPRDLVTDAPCRTTQPNSPKCARPSSTKSPSGGDKPSPPPSRLEAPSIDESSQPRPKLMLGTKASGPPLIPRFSHLGSASDTRSHAGKRARPCLPPGCRRSSRATCRSSTSAVVWTRKHNPDLPRPRRSCAVMVTARWVTPTPKSRRQPGIHSSGVTPTLSRLRHPHVDLLRQRGFSPN